MEEMSNDMSNSDDLSIQMLSMPTLGRHFDLGTVYDAIRDVIIPGFTFWNGSDLKNVKTTRNAYTEFSIIASDKLTDKFQELKVSGSLQVSILCGMIKLSGSANYLDKKKKSTSRQSSVHVKLKCRTAVKKLSIEKSDEINLRYPEIQSTGTIGFATHFVRQIQYGAEATFTFTQKLRETDKEQEVNGQLKLSAERFIKFLIVNENVDGADIDQENENNIECIFQGDFELPNEVDRPTTYNEAIKFAKKFLQFSSDWMAKDPLDANKSLGVPVRVWLYPLQDAQGAAALQHEINLTLASPCVGIMENYGQVEDKLVLMLEDPLLNKLNSLLKKLQLFQRCLTSFIAELKRKLGEMVVGIRSGQDSAADSFRQLTTRITNEQFPFNFNHLNQWLDQKHKELCLVKRFQDEVKNKLGNQSKVLFFGTQEEMAKFPVDFGFEFSFSSLSRPEPFLDQLNQPLGTNYFNEISSTTNDLTIDLWYENYSVIQRIQKEISLFAGLVNVKSNDEKFAFAMTAPDEYDETCATQFSIIVHQEKKRIFGEIAVLIACQHYLGDIYTIFNIRSIFVERFQSEKLIDVVRLLVEEKIPEELNPFPLLALCCFYQNESLIDIVRLLIEKNIDVHCKNKYGLNALHLLCCFYDKENLIDIIRLLIEKNVDVNSKDNDGCNALHLVCQHYNQENLIDIIRLLIEKNIDVNDGGCILHWVCQRYGDGYLIDIADIVRLLIEKNIDVNCEDDDGWNALLSVCRYYDKENLIDIVRLLIEKNVDVNCKDSGGRYVGRNALHFVCRYYDKENLIDIIRLLIEKNIDVNCKDDGGWNALHFVCRDYRNENLIDIIRLLIEKNIDVNCKELNYGMNALHWVCLNNQNENLIDIVRLLIEKNIDVNCEGYYGRNALHSVCKGYRNENLIDIVRLLIEKNIDVNSKGEYGRNALHFLCDESYENGNLIDIADIVRLLIEKDVDVNCKDSHGQNALHLVCQHYQKENLIDIVRLLIEANIDVNCKDNFGCNALHFVCEIYENGNLIDIADIVRLLIEKNVDVNCKDNNGQNALHSVCKLYRNENLIDIVRLLIEANIDVNCKDKNGWNALHFVLLYAPKTLLLDLVQLLGQHKIDKKVETTGGEIGTARSFLLKRFKEEEIADVLQLLDS